jgi:hypothetical protein
MLQQDDLEAAVAMGIIDRRQLAALGELAAERRLYARTNRDEPFRLLKNFNEVFLTIGVLLVLFGVAGVGAYVAGSFRLSSPSASTFFIFPFLVTCWGLAELLTGRMRAVAPSIVLAVAFAGAASLLVIVGVEGAPRKGPANTALYFCLGYVAGLAATVLHYARFRLPFSVGLMGAFALGIAMSFARWAMPAVSLGLVALICGVAIFAVAIWYDFSDPGRRTRRHQCAFWLHMLAAPLIVHGLFQLIAPAAAPATGLGAMASIWGQLGLGAGTVPSLWIVLPIFIILALLALGLDRRAILVASLSYLGAALAATFSKFGSTGLVAALTPLLIGVLVLLLGTGWQHIRARLLSTLPLDRATSRLPPW